MMFAGPPAGDAQTRVTAALGVVVVLAPAGLTVSLLYRARRCRGYAVLC